MAIFRQLATVQDCRPIIHESYISDTEAQIADPRRDGSVPDFATEGQLQLSCKPGVGHFSRVSS
jgi:hypothetical protein